MDYFKINSVNMEQNYPLHGYDVEGSLLVSKAGDISRLFDVTLPQVFTSSNKELFSYHDAWVRALNVLPENTIVLKQDYFIGDEYREEVREDDPFLKQRSAEHFNGKKMLRHRCIVCVTMSTERNLNIYSNPKTNFLLRKKMIPDVVLDDDAISKWKGKVEQFVRILQGSEMELRELSAEELLGDRQRFGLLDQYMSLNFTGRDEVMKDIFISKDDRQLKVGDDYVSMFGVTDLEEMPGFVYDALRNKRLSTDVSEIANCFPSEICMQLGFEHIYSQIIFIPDGKKFIKKLELDGRNMKSLSAISRENDINKDMNEEYINEAVTGKRPVQCSFIVMAWDKKYRALLEKNSQIAAALSSMDCTVNKIEGIVPELFWSLIPGAGSNFPQTRKVTSFMQQACCFLNFESNYRDLCGEDRIGIKLTDRQYGIPVIVDVSNYPMTAGLIDNKNKFILGSSGSGKSFFTNAMVGQKYLCGDHIVIVDVGDSYKTQCELINEESGGVDGIYYTYTEKNPIRFNPFYSENGVIGEEKMENLCGLVQILWKKPTEPIGKNEETQLRTSIARYLEKVQNGEVRPCFNTYYEYLKGDFKQMVTEKGVLRDNFDIDNMIQCLEPFYKGGQYDYLLNSEENIDLTKKRFVVFELDNIKDHPVLFPVVTMIIMDTFIMKMRFGDASERKMMLIEEAWKAISQSGMAEFIKYLYKTVRKHNGEVAVVTQEPEDLIGNAVIKNSIINSADVKILLDLTKFEKKFDDIMSALALSDKDAAMALSVNKMVPAPYKEVFISFNGKFSCVYRVETSWGEALSFTSRKEEKKELEAFRSQTGSMRKAIMAYMRSKLMKKAS